jgi:hypothetical protein
MKRKHGEARKTPEYWAWIQMKQRCYNKNRPKYKHYGAIGITVCKRWLNSYENFLLDVGRKPSSKHSLERKNGKRGYSPSNCEWATPKIQNNNRSNNIVLKHDGKKMNITQWSLTQGIKRSTIISRLRYGWDVARALTKPVTQRI